MNFWLVISREKYISAIGLQKFMFMLHQLTIICLEMSIQSYNGIRQTKYVSFRNQTYIDESVSYDGYPQNAEKVNGRWAMVGFVALVVLM